LEYKKTTLVVNSFMASTTPNNDDDLIDMSTQVPAAVDTLLGIKYISASKTKVVAEMLITKNHTQPMGLMHGGVSCVIAESVGSVASNIANNNKPGETAMVGLSLVANHLRSGIVGDTVVATATPLHVGMSSHVWNIELVSKKDGYRICSARLTTHVMKLNGQKHSSPFLSPVGVEIKDKNGLRGNGGVQVETASKQIGFKHIQPTVPTISTSLPPLPDGSLPIPARL
jgi:uncharacterized protein (TIGR00369 family)